MLARHFAPYGDVFGEQGVFDVPFGFTGEPYDQNGLTHLRARYYDSQFGRFFQMDPSRLEQNLYEYALSSPTMNIDPSGLTACEGCDCSGYVGTAKIVCEHFCGTASQLPAQPVPVRLTPLPCGCTLLPCASDTVSIPGLGIETINIPVLLSFISAGIDLTNPALPYPLSRLLDAASLTLTATADLTADRTGYDPHLDAFVLGGDTFLETFFFAAGFVFDTAAEVGDIIITDYKLGFYIGDEVKIVDVIINWNEIDQAVLNLAQIAYDVSRITGFEDWEIRVPAFTRSSENILREYGLGILGSRQVRVEASYTEAEERGEQCY